MSNSSGILNILKPPGITSFSVIRIIKKIFYQKKVGHTGTLDPAAAGVLGICLGKATKIIPYLDDSIKTYICEMELGFQTDSLDLEGNVIKEDLNWSNLTVDRIESLFCSLKGKHKQIPPMFSALHHNGQRLYHLARRGIYVKREKREIEIYNIKLINISLPVIRFKVVVSRGCYIRSLVRDIGIALNSSATMTFLLRTQSGKFHIADSHIISDLNKKDKVLKPIYLPLDFPKAVIKQTAHNKAVNGNFLVKNDFKKLPKSLKINDNLLVFSDTDEFISINRKIYKDDLLVYQPEKVFI
ncbi:MULTISPECIES: tRNA pseudouridine(55) synthase TruB [unclassified Halanaerobium]|uniref:tRNA pseudouridine(55) synthase TruB n=1 Tax=unclassified Halanaerobium TaxID=2641197 RepID=UPI000DF25A20|nr:MULTISPECIES: tRNA pseudouridine(55) synthase TruB [unclassified Halanaerobium]RCW51562.1 tRNA pseudouridine synthase B [Halanaerobium sp. MA284_MarDTE_T2]RCW89350.1 tRNA pseudouridine synthase B [Halanaerobium sp. DL-01]